MVKPVVYRILLQTNLMAAREVARERSGLTEEQLEEALDPLKMTGPS